MNQETNFQFYTDYPSGWQAMLAAMEEARKSIEFEQYCFMDFGEGSIGRKFADLFLRKAKEGVKVRLLIEAQASFDFYISDLGKILENAGVEVVFHTLSRHKLPHFFRMFFRDHRKLLIVDSKIAFIGGNIVKDKAVDWRDTLLKLEGPTAKLLERVFNDAFQGLRRNNKFAITAPQMSGNFEVLTSGPMPRYHYILRRILEAFRNAKRSIYITSPYFNPPRSVLRALARALARGVEVHIMLPGKSDNILADFVSESYYDTILRSGMRLYLHDAYVHAKTIVVDDSWSTMGSANFDRLSLHFDYEANVSSTEGVFTRELLDHFHKDLERASELKLIDWRSRSLYRKILEVLSWPFRLVV
jgi:cardiolipin synthase A/B